MILQLIVSVGIAVIVSAMCSVFEAALYSVSTGHIEVLSRSGKKSGDILRKLKSDIHRPITAILTLNTIANTMGAAVAGASAAVVFGDKYLGLFSAAFTLTILLFSEILPKTTGVAYNKQIAPFIARPLSWLVTLLSPAIWLCQVVNSLVPGHKKEAMVSAEEVQAIAYLSRKSGEINFQEERVITNILDLKNKSVRQIMTPRTVTFTMHESIKVGEAVDLKEKWDYHSRVPVYDKDQDDIIGFVLRKDVLIHAAEGNTEKRLGEIINPVHFVPESAPLTRILLDFFDKRSHLFVVVDEYGAFTGVVTLEDVIEEIVGREIIDETDLTRDMRELARQKRKELIEQQRSLGNERG